MAKKNIMLLNLPDFSYFGLKYVIKQDQRSTAPTLYQLGPLSHLGPFGSHLGPSGNDLGPFGNHLGPFGRHLVPFGSHTSLFR